MLLAAAIGLRGLEQVVPRWNAWWSGGVTVLLLLAFVGRMPKIWEKPEIEDTRGVLSALVELPDRDPVYVHHEAVPAVRYYTKLHPHHSFWDSRPFHHLTWDTDYGQLADTMVTPSWIVVTHLISDQARERWQLQDQAIREHRRVTQEVHRTGTVAIYLE